MRYRGGGPGHRLHRDQSVDSNQAPPEADENDDNQNDDEDMDIPSLTEQQIDEIVESHRLGAMGDDDEPAPIDEDNNESDSSSESSEEEDEIVPGDEIVELQDPGRTSRVEGDDGYAVM